MAVIVKTEQTMKPKIVLCLALILSGALPAVVQAKFIYSTNADGVTVTITGYTGSDGVVTIPDTINGLPVVSVGNNAFARHPTLTSITIPDCVTNIGDWAFTATDSYSSLTNVLIGNNVNSIGRGAFHFCDKLTSIKIPKSVISIGDGALSGCFGLKKITVDANNPAYSSVDAVLFNKSQTELVQFPGGKAGNYTIPDSITNIGDYAMWNCPELTSIIIPEGVTSIKKEAFAACGNLISVTIPSSVTNIEIWAFDSCVSLKGVYFHGNAPGHGEYRGYKGISIYHAFDRDSKAIVYYLPGTTGWGKTFDGRPTALWKP
jgi:BspA type Leucine rich repeat region (6 copies)